MLLLEKYPYSEFPCAYFPAFGLITESYEVSLRVQSKCGKTRTRNIPNTNIFHAVHFTYKVHVCEIYHIFLNKLPGRLFQNWALRIGAYSRGTLI